MSSESALTDVDFDTPQPIGLYKFFQEITKVNEADQKVSTFQFPEFAVPRCFISRDAIKNVDFSATEPVGRYTFLQDRVDKAKQEIEKKKGCDPFTKFEAIKFVKKGSRYLVRVDCGGEKYIDVKLRMVDYRGFESVDGLGDPLRLDSPMKII